jgi:hypothetical protein
LVSESFHSGDRVSFSLAGALCPDARDITRQLTPEVEVAGEIMFLSDHGKIEDRFAIVCVGGLMTPVVVPVERLSRIAPQYDGRAANEQVEQR